MEVSQPIPALAGAVKTKARRIIPGKVIRVSQKVHDVLSQKLHEKDSWDSLLRRLHGIPGKKLHAPALREYFILPSTMQVFQTLGKARGAAVVNSVKKGMRKAELPLRVREVI